MPVEIKFDVRGLKVPQEAMQVIQYRLRHMTPALFRAGKEFEVTLDKRYAAQGGAYSFGGAYKVWARNKPSTIKQKGHKIVLIGGGPKKGKLRKSIRSVARGNELRIKYEPYGEYHMRGHSKGLFPKRPFAFPTRGDLGKIFDHIVRYITRGST